MIDAVSITRDLVRCPSVTPADAGALGVLENLLKAAGFDVHRVTFSEPGTADTQTANYLEQSESDEGFYRHELVGLRAVDLAGKTLGTVSDLLLAPAQDLLEVTTAGGEKILVPFVYEIVPDVDLDNQVVTMDPPGGLFPPH